MAFAPPRRLASFVFLALAAALTPCGASTNATSSASSAASESADSASSSVEKSSDSSSSSGKKVAAGDYKVIHMAMLPERPGMWRLNLQAITGAGGKQDGFFLYLPQAVIDKTPLLAVGGVVTARARPYGLELAHGDRQEAFFLVLDDDWHRDLQTRALAL
jgi:hypothetical protein